MSHVFPACLADRLVEPIQFPTARAINRIAVIREITDGTGRAGGGVQAANPVRVNELNENMAVRLVTCVCNLELLESSAYGLRYSMKFNKNANFMVQNEIQILLPAARPWLQQPLKL